ncbi:MAG: hypothetical protein L3J09_00100 [Flavobacteriaceae bacterium]|nr:hypothetical protein [Flavobacteriaceae bacterium]
MKQQLYNILEKFVLNNNIKINSEDFKLQLISNPSFPSVKAISDTLDYFGIENIVANVPKDALNQLPECFLAVLEKDRSKIIAQVQKIKNGVRLLKEDGGKEKVSLKEFNDLWNGTIIAVEKNTEEVSNKTSFNNPFLPLLTIGVLILGYLFSTQNLQEIFYTTFSVIGFIVSFLIVRESFGLQNKSTTKICNSSEKNTNCSEVINDKTSKIFGLISLSDASITYFASLLVIITFLGYNTSFFLGLSALSIPLIIYSLYAQAYIVKKWCPLCLGIAAVFTVQIAITLLPVSNLDINIFYIIKSVALFTTSYFLWLLIKGTIKKSLNEESLQIEFYKFKRNEKLFSTLLKNERLITNQQLESSSKITFGNPDAKLEIISITNPLCGFCTKAFERYDSLLEKFGDKIKLTIIFNVSSENLENPSTQISQRIIELYQENKEDAYKALKNWFSHRDVDKWQLEYNKPTMLSNYNNINSQYKWCLDNKIDYTPATLIGDNFFPKEYEIKDLSLFMDYLIATQNKNIEKEPSMN